MSWRARQICKLLYSVYMYMHVINVLCMLCTMGSIVQIMVVHFAPASCSYRFSIHLSALKWQCHEIFFPWTEPTWTPDKQAKMVLLKDSFSRRYSWNTVSDFAQTNIARSQTPHRLTMHGVEFFETKIRMHPRKRIFPQNQFCLVVRGTGWFCSWKKNLVTLSL